MHELKNTRAVNDRNLTIGQEQFIACLKNINLDGKIVFDFGMGTGWLEQHLLSLKNENKPAVIVGFELQQHLNSVSSDVLIKQTECNKIYPTLEDRKNTVFLVNPKQFQIIDPEICSSPPRGRGRKLSKL